jgi:outer membrane protein assembly factor BamB
MTTFLRVIGILLLVILISCKKNAPGITDPPGVNWVTKPQVAIPWPGLASSPWPMYQHDPQHTGRSEYRGPQEGRVEWAFETGGFVYSSPVIGSDGSVLVHSNDHLLYALTPDAILKWTFDMGAVSEATATVAADGTIYAASGDSVFHALSSTGASKWSIVVGGSGKSAVPSPDGEMIYYSANATDGGTHVVLHAFTKNGIPRWTFIPQARDLTVFPPAVAPDGRTIYCAGFNYGQSPALYAVDSSGIQRWRFVAQGTGSVSHVSTPAVDNDGNVYVACSNTLYSISPNGIIRWQFSGARNTYDVGPAIGGDGSIYMAGNGGLFAFDYAGTLKWVYQLGISMCIPAIDREGTIYIGRARATFQSPSDTVNFVALKPDGSLKFQLALRLANGQTADIDSKPAISSDGSIYVGCDQPGGHRIFKIK